MGGRVKKMGGGMMKRKPMMKGSKPDFLDLDKDKNKTESMKSAATSAKGMMKGGRVKKMGGGMSTRRRDMKSGDYPDDMGMKGGPMMKKGGRVKKKKQGYIDRKDESIAMRIKKKRTKKQLTASRDESYGKFGSKAKKSGKINR